VLGPLVSQVVLKLFCVVLSILEVSLLLGDVFVLFLSLSVLCIQLTEDFVKFLKIMVKMRNVHS
jgi:hypothetical protein